MQKYCLNIFAPKQEQVQIIYSLEENRMTYFLFFLSNFQCFLFLLLFEISV